LSSGKQEHGSVLAVVWWRIGYKEPIYLVTNMDFAEEACHRYRKLGVLAKRDGWVAISHRTDRCDLSLFQLGLSLLEHSLDEGIGIPEAFRMPTKEKSVR
jgi:hypothetical protein